MNKIRIEFNDQKLNYTIEKLIHFVCPNCKTGFNISDKNFKNLKKIGCPFCFKRYNLFKKMPKLEEKIKG